jgi:hypothetical protein
MAPSMKSFRSLACFALLGLSSVAFPGCETTGKSTNRLGELRENFIVTRGMSAEELAANLGEPDFKRPLEEYSVEAVVWSYQREVATDAEMVITDTRKEFYWDSVRREVIEIEVPVLQPEVEMIVEFTEILMVDDRVHSWKRKVSQRRDIEGMTR